MSRPFERSVLRTLVDRLNEPRARIQVLAGPRQTGKTTIALQVRALLGDDRVRYASADEPTIRGGAWIESQWEIARSMPAADDAVLMLDEVQKLPGWSETVKRLWDEDTAAGRSGPKLVLLGSAPLLIGSGLSESLGGRFELTEVRHWSFAEMHEAFGWELDQYLYFGGYPGAAELIGDEDRWRAYVNDSLIETTISRDVLLMSRVDKPALLRRLFELGCRHSGEILSYNKMLGQLDDAGNTTTLAYYLDLLAAAGMIVGLGKYTGSAMRRRRSSPKLCVLNTALASALSGRSFEETRADRAAWGRLVESAVGAHLINTAHRGAAVTYWRDRNREVDFVLTRGDSTTAIEVKSGRRRDALPGMAAFLTANPGSRPLLVGGDGIEVEALLSGAFKPDA